jgi:hypothetical protein
MSTWGSAEAAAKPCEVVGAAAGTATATADADSGRGGGGGRSISAALAAAERGGLLVVEPASRLGPALEGASTVWRLTDWSAGVRSMWGTR